MTKAVAPELMQSFACVLNEPSSDANLSPDLHARIVLLRQLFFSDAVRGQQYDDNTAHGRQEFLDMYAYLKTQPMDQHGHFDYLFVNTTKKHLDLMVSMNDPRATHILAPDYLRDLL